MRKSELKMRETLARQTIVVKEYLPEIKKAWEKYGFCPDDLLDENDDFYNLLLDYHKTRYELDEEARMFSRAYGEYSFQVADDKKTYRKLYNFAVNSLCGLYNVRQRRYFTTKEISSCTELYLSLMGRGYDYFQKYKCEKEYDELFGKYSAILENITALLIAADVSQYLDEKKMRDAHITKSNADKFVRFGPRAGYIFDTEIMGYRKPKDFEEYAYYIHADYWFHDPSKGYKPDAHYKWDSDLPSSLLE